MNIGELLLGALLFKGLTAKGSSSPPPPPPPPPASDANKGGNHLAEDLGKVAGTGIGLLGSALFGGVGGGGAVGGGTTIATSVGASSAALEASGSAAELSLASTGLTLGGAFAFAWGVVFILQFIVINIVNAMRIEQLRFQDKVRNLNNPYWSMHRLEVFIVEEALKSLGLPFDAYDADDHAIEGSKYGDDPRLYQISRQADEGQQHFTGSWHFRTIVRNPFTGNGAAWKWRFVQMGARLIAARYVFDLGVLARSFYRGWFHVSYPTAWEATPLQVWAYPLVGGGQPDKTYAAYHTELQQLGAAVFPVDQALQAAHLSAVLHVASLIAEDPGVYSPIDFNPVGYSVNVYNAMGLSEANDGFRLVDHRWFIDVARYGIPIRQLYLDTQSLKAGWPMQPFLISPPHVIFTTPPSQTSLVAVP